MSAFTKIARPFQLPSMSYPRRIVPVGEKPPENLVLDIGGHGNIKKMSGSESYAWHGYQKKKIKEKGAT